MDEGIRLLEATSRFHQLFQSQDVFQKRRILRFVLWNSTWKDGVLDARLRQPFDLLASTNLAYRAKQAAGAPESEARSIWRGFMDAYGTMSNPPDPNMASVFNDFKVMGTAA